MTHDFDGLLPPRRPVPPLPERGGAPVVTHAARRRRRRSATRAAGGGTAVMLALTALLSAMPSGGPHGLTQHEPLVAPSATPDRADLAPLPRRPASGRAGEPRPAPPAASTTAPASAHATPRAEGSVPPRPTATATPARPTTAPEGTRWVRIDRSLVADDPAAPCAVVTGTDDPSSVLCLRYTGPNQAQRGEAVGLSYDFCARVAAVTARFPSSQEAMFRLRDANDAIVWTGLSRPDGTGRHEVTVPQGQCLRYTAHWDGRDDAGNVPPPGTYGVMGNMLDENADTYWGAQGDATVTLSDGGAAAPGGRVR